MGALNQLCIKINLENNELLAFFVPIIAPFQTLPKSTEINLKPVFSSFNALDSISTSTDFDLLPINSHTPM